MTMVRYQVCARGYPFRCPRPSNPQTKSARRPLATEEVAIGCGHLRVLGREAKDTSFGCKTLIRAGSTAGVVGVHPPGPQRPKITAANSSRGRVEDGRGSFGAYGHHAVSHPSSSNWTCGATASCSPTGFTARPTAGQVVAGVLGTDVGAEHSTASG
jgi:hypothetical protein